MCLAFVFASTWFISTSMSGPAFEPLFGILHGADNGILTIAKGTLPRVLFGSTSCGARQGGLMAPARAAQALAPYLFGVALDRPQSGALWVTAGLGLAAFTALLVLDAENPVDAQASVPSGASR